MNKNIMFDRNILALSHRNPSLCARLSHAETTLEKYRILQSRSGLVVPAITRISGEAQPLHSMIDPQKEAVRLASTIRNAGFILFLGLGAGYAIREILKRQDISHLTIVEYDIDALAELLSSVDYIDIFNDRRVCLLIDPQSHELREHILNGYRPELHGSIVVQQLRSRIENSFTEFSEASEHIKQAIQSVSDDYSVQAYFGKRWFVNTIRNLSNAQTVLRPVPPVRHVSICAAGPSLETQYPVIRNMRKKTFLLAADTALPALLQNDIVPDAVISIDCQHISYLHFMNGIPQHIPLFLDLASPPLLAEVSENIRFFSGGHPLTVYVSRHWKPFPLIDTSGGNVSYAAVSLADTLGAEHIDLYGADFSYPQGNSYARDTYIHTYFQRKQNRFCPLESCFSSFLFRNTELYKINDGNNWRYETKPLIGYRKHLEVLSTRIQAELHQHPETGLPFKQGRSRQNNGLRPLFNSGPALCSAKDFIKKYRSSINKLRCLDDGNLSLFSDIAADERDILITLLPTAAALRRRTPGISNKELMKQVKLYCLTELDRVSDSFN